MPNLRSGAPPVVHGWRSPDAPGTLACMGKHGGRVGLGLLVAAALMVPWIYLLSGSLPDTTRVSGWSRAWVGLDVMEGFALLGTGVLLLRRDPRVSPVAAVTAALLLVDAWFDVTTSASGHALAIALGMALLAELPLCALCGLIAARTLEFERRRRAIPYPQ